MAAAPFLMEFERKYRVVKGEYVPYDVVHVFHAGMSQRSKTPLLINEISRVRPDGDPDNPAWLAAKMQWDIIRPAYEAWQSGQQLPETGTPIGAWPGITAEQAAMLRQVGFRSVEDFAAASDSVLGRIQLPNARALRDLASTFLASSDKAKIADALAQKDREMADLKAQLEEMRQIVIEASRQAEPDLEPDGSEAPRRRGRPPKVHVEPASVESAA